MSLHSSEATRAQARIMFDGRTLNRREGAGVERYVEELHSALRQIHPIETVRPRFRNRWYDHGWIHSLLPARAVANRVHALFCPVGDAPFLLPGGIRLVVTIHDLSFLRYPEMYNASFRRYYQSVLPLVLRRADRVICVSETECRHVHERFPVTEQKTRVIYHGIASRYSDDGRAREPRILAVASTNKHKNLTRLVEAFSAVKDRIPHRLVLVGGARTTLSHDSQLEPAIAQLEREGRAERLGYVDEAELIRLYRTSEMFVFPSLFEGFGLPPLEAMACGCPVATSNSSAMPEICGDAALYFEPTDVNAIASSILQLANDSAQRAELSRRGRERAMSFTWRRAAEQTLDALLS